ncbi:hypothetical protein TD95_002702 [Thielaviopsis punctulata]|uniref:lytic cellulose monooxygenase (C4-dehydrogenating) n=1 Tax=Thielaviopsis punctulata TaxID=72032 RepID=A0A0F4Z661_9PEZI|nr:hypothetical protein TD95_002702 [Thielaviopsis punctulata]
MIFSRVSPLLAAATLVPSAMAHYNFEALILKGEATSPYEYVRSTTNSNSPITDVTSKDMICNAGGISEAIRSKTKTASVKAGDEVGFTVNVEIGHPGPLSVWMSKATTTAQEYEGDGDWFKVYELTTSSITSAGLQWATTTASGGAHNFTFTLPDQLPSGEYLMRAEHIALHGAGTFGGAQFYIGCAQLSVEGTGTGTPSPTASIPGMYTGKEPGIEINLYYPVPTEYTAPGIETWPNKCIDHTINLEGQKSDGDCNGDSGSGSGSSAGSSSVASSPAATATSAAATSAAATATSAAATSAAAAATSPAATSAASSTSSAAATGATSSCSRRRRARRAVIEN